jgi:hypothetical protein
VNRLTRILPSFPPSSPWQWLDLDDYGLSADDVTRYAWYLTERSQFGGHLAFTALLKSQPEFGWRFLGNLIETPPISWFAAAAYRLIARYRHLLPGGTPACALPRNSR